ncbi:hypothetical protein Y710_01915 [Gordonia sp. QH-12]|uniref:hypothetical protein n=1 Tax=Gordonia sp. QH-12 TaxID=1437876 RepID=UPI00078107F8|nr:hypothetical protein [Gordonia sp. QH-12]KXT58652.1 hypothetical protein Y710_01915 [Gordonia sp. QH-12]
MSLRTSLRSVFIALLALATALPFLASPAHAAPQQPRAQVQRNADDVTVKVFGATVAVEGGNLVFRNASGKALDVVPLTYVGKDARTYPIDATVKGDVATLVPSKDAARSTTTPASVLEAGKKPAQRVICGPQTRKQRDKEALDQMNSELATAATIGGIAGAIIGAIIGILGSGGPLALIASPIGALLGAGGAVAGAAINGTFARYFKTINSPFKPKVCNI